MLKAEVVAVKLNDLYIIDIRKPEDFAINNIPNSVNILMEDLGEKLDMLPKDQTI